MAEMHLPAFQTALHGFADGDALRQSEANRGIDADALAGSLFNGGNACFCDGNLDDHVGR